MNLNLLCTVRLNRNWRSDIEAVLICFVPSTSSRQRTAAGDHVLDTITTDGIVRLLTFDKDCLYQIPLELITLCEPK